MTKKGGGANDLDTVILLYTEQMPVESNDIIGLALQCRSKKDVIGRILRDTANDVQIVGHKCQQMKGSNEILDQRVGDAVFQENANDFSQDRRR